MILHAPGVDRGNRGSIAVPDKKPAAQADRVEHAGKHVQRLLVHEGDRTRQFRRRRAAVSGAGVDENARAGRCGELLSKAAPACNAAEPLVQQYEARRRVGARSNHAIFKPHLAKLEMAVVGEHHRAPPAAKLATVRASFAKLCSTASSEVSSSACARA